MKIVGGTHGPRISRLVVFGVGLIGGSFALALKKHNAVGHVIGIGRSLGNLRTARRRRVIDEIVTDVGAAVRDADVVLLAVPPAQTAKVLRQIGQHLGPHTIVSDTGSIKQDVLSTARATLGPAFARFVAAHPVAGNENSGAAAASADLFEGRTLVVTPHSRTNVRALKLITALWKICGMSVVTMRAAEHDRVFALVSHLPHFISFALVNQIAAQKDGRRLFQRGGGGLRDMSRIAGSSPEMWRDIALANRTALLKAFDGYRREIETLRMAIADSNGVALEKYLIAAARARRRWLPSK